MAEDIAELPRWERDIFAARAERPDLVKQHADPVVDMKEVLVALANVLHRAEMFQHHEVQLEPLSVRERMSDVLAAVSAAEDFVTFVQLFRPEEGRRGIVVTFLALTELIREGLIDFVQSEPFAPIYLRTAGE